MSELTPHYGNPHCEQCEKGERMRNGFYKVELDGNQWGATLPGFINLQESYAGFGETKELAIIDLLESLYSDARAAAISINTGNSGSCGDCELNEEMIDARKSKYPIIPE